MIKYDRLTFLRLVGEYGHAEFMLGMERMGSLRDHKAEVAREACDKLTNYVGDALAGRDPAALDGLLEAVKAFISDGGPDGTGWREIGKHVDAMAAALAAFQGGDS